MYYSITPNKLFSDKIIISDKNIIRSNNIDIIINYYDFNSIDTSSIKKGHHVHIFICEIMDSFYGNDNFFEFVNECAVLSNNTVFIHIPKIMNKLKYSIESKLYGSRDYKILIESKCVLFKYESHYNSYYQKNRLNELILVLFDKNQMKYIAFPVTIPLLKRNKVDNDLANLITDKYLEFAKYINFDKGGNKK